MAALFGRAFGATAFWALKKPFWGQLIGFLWLGAAAQALGADGPRLLATFECNRCHEGTGLPKPPSAKQCVSCHQNILAGTFSADKNTLKTWQSHLHSLNAAPSLQSIGLRLRRDWVQSFLLQPTDVRPALAAMMPRLDLTAAQARDLAFTLIPSEQNAKPSGDEAAGGALFQSFGCLGCHRATGFPVSAAPTPNTGKPPAPVSAAALWLAPDLRYTRDRFQPGALTRFLVAPSQVKPDTLMPTFGFTEKQAADLASFLLYAPLEKTPAPAIPRRLPPLRRKVSFSEVNERVFRRICWHCHSTPAYADGDGGPGHTGGFGFRPRGFSVTTYAEVMSGSLDATGERQSVFRHLPDGTPWLLELLLLRQKEVAGEQHPKLRGMPLGFPPLSPEQIQLVESWIAQGRPE